jgi:HD superfamily phosphohydrolase
MEMGLKDILENLGDVGCARHEAEIAGELYKNGQTDELIRFLKKCRCSLMDEMHESQRKVDRMDYLIRRVEKETEL